MIGVFTSVVWSSTGSTVGAVVSSTVIVNVVSVSLYTLSDEITVTSYVPAFVGVPEIVFVSELYVTPSGRPYTSFRTVSPLLSFALITIGSIGEFTSVVLLSTLSTTGGVVSSTITPDELLLEGLLFPILD